MGVAYLKIFGVEKTLWVAVNYEGFLPQKFHAIQYVFHVHLHDTIHVDSESMLETRKQKETNWMLIGICLSVGVLFAGVCVAITILIIIIIIRKGTSYRIRCMLA